MKQVLNISDLTPIGSGVDRIVYPHPENPDLCIKLPRRTPEKIRVREVRDAIFYLSRFGRKQYLDYNFTDVEYAGKLAARGDSELFRHIPQCHGFVDTDRGRGVVWERIRDFDGRPCLSLKEYRAANDDLSAEAVGRLWAALQEFFSWQLKHGILLREMAYSNTLLRRMSEDRLRLYHIDAIGCADLVPFAAYATWFARIRAYSKVSRFRKRMVQWLGPQQTTT